MTLRTLDRVIPAIAAKDGAGVKLRRSLGASQMQRHGPFVMNTREEIEQAVRDYRTGALSKEPVKRVNVA